MGAAEEKLFVYVSCRRSAPPPSSKIGDFCGTGRVSFPLINSYSPVEMVSMMEQSGLTDAQWLPEQ